MTDTSNMFKVDCVPDNDGELRRKAQEDGWQAAALGVGKGLEEAKAENRLLHAELDRLRASIGPQSCDIHAAFSAGCLNCRLVQREAQLFEANEKAKSYRADAINAVDNLEGAAAYTAELEASLAAEKARLKYHDDNFTRLTNERAAAEAESARLKDLLRQVQWEGEHYDGDGYRSACVRCGGAQADGCRPGCDLQAALSPETPAAEREEQ